MASNPSVPSSQVLLTQIQQLQTALGLLGANPQAFFAVRDAGGFQRVRIGFLPNGDYGIWFADDFGVAQELLPTYAASVASLVTCVTNGGLFLSGPSVTAVIGASGKALIRLSGIATNSNNANNGLIEVGLNAATLGAVNGPYLTAAGTFTAGIQMAEQVVTRLTPGENTFQLWGVPAGTTPVTCSITKSTLVVQPL
jgi:hypothetical protein